MAWQETVVMEQRMQFVLAAGGEPREPLAAVCRRFGVSRQTGYKWLKRYQAQGVAGLADRSRAPARHPNAIDARTEAAVLKLRQAHPTWGPRKLLVVLRWQDGDGQWPSASTIGALLQRRGLSVPRKRRRRVPRQAVPLSAGLSPNDLWCIDFKGWFRTGDGSRCDPLTISDAASRYLLRVQVAPHTGHDAVRPLLEAAFREYGLPRAIRSDNGVPFASRAVAGLSPLSIWWLKLGIVHQRIDPGCPQQNGAHERSGLRPRPRMHLTLKGETARPPAATLRAQQRRFDAFRAGFNHQRPHEALAMATPGSCYQASDRPYPAREPQLAYPGLWVVRKVQHNGEFFWHDRPVFLSEVLRRELIGLEPLDGRYWRTHLGPLQLGIFDSRHRRMLTGAQQRRWDRHRSEAAEPQKVSTMCPV
jgi:transposase InsO family protein